MRLELALVLFALPLAAAAQDSTVDAGGHTKITFTGQSWPDDSLIRDIVGATSTDWQGDLRLNLEWRNGKWRIDTNWQLVALTGDGLGITSLALINAIEILDLNPCNNAGDCPPAPVCRDPDCQAGECLLVNEPDLTERALQIVEQALEVQGETRTLRTGLNGKDQPSG